VQDGIYADFVAAGVKRTEKIRQGDPLDTDTMLGAQASNDQLEKILSYISIGKEEGAAILTGGERADLGGELAGGFYVQPTVFEGSNSMRIFQEEIFGPVLSVARFSGFDDAVKIANDTLYGLGAAVWTRDVNTGYRAARAIQAGRVWLNAYHAYPAHAAFGGYKQSGVGRGESQDDAGSLPAHQERPRQLLRERPGILLMSQRVALTEQAADLLRQLARVHGPLMFHQSGGCCDGSAPMCYPLGEFRVGGSDVLLGTLAVRGGQDVPFYMSRSQFGYWKHTQLTVDVVAGRGSGFSLEAPERVRFIIRSRLFFDQEAAALPEP